MRTWSRGTLPLNRTVDVWSVPPWTHWKCFHGVSGHRALHRTARWFETANQRRAFKFRHQNELVRTQDKWPLKKTSSFALCTPQSALRAWNYLVFTLFLRPQFGPNWFVIFYFISTIICIYLHHPSSLGNFIFATTYPLHYGSVIPQVETQLSSSHHRICSVDWSDGLVRNSKKLVWSLILHHLITITASEKYESHVVALCAFWLTLFYLFPYLSRRLTPTGLCFRLDVFCKFAYSNDPSTHRYHSNVPQILQVKQPWHWHGTC